MTQESIEHSKPLNVQWKERVIQAITKCGLRLRTEVSEVDIEVYCDVLRERNAIDIERAFDECSRELAFMPKPKELIERLPEPKSSPRKLQGKVIKEWTEPYGDDKRVRYFLTDANEKVIRIENA